MEIHPEHNWTQQSDHADKTFHRNSPWSLNVQTLCDHEGEKPTPTTTGVFRIKQRRVRCNVLQVCSPATDLFKLFLWYINPLLYPLLHSPERFILKTAHHESSIYTKKTAFTQTFPTAFTDALLQSCGCLFVGCWTSQQHASVSQGWICSDNIMCCHTEIEAANQTFHLTQSQYIDTGLNCPSTDPITPGTWQGSHWSAKSLVWLDPPKNPSASRIWTRVLPLFRRTP